MTLPRIEVIPIRPATRADAPVTLDILLRVTPPQPAASSGRPALNLGLVLDRSGSMAGQNKLGFARDVAVCAVEQLLPTDRVSVTVFDDKVETIVPNTAGENKARVAESIRAVRTGGSTALYGAWQEGAAQVRGHLVAGGLNRVILLSDGLANVGLTDPDAISTEVHRLAAEGVNTTTMGVGDDYAEDLLEAMAKSGGGNYYYIESPRQLADLFQSELKGLVATFGGAVSLGVEPQGGAVVADILNDFDPLPTGRLKLPNLVAGMPVVIVVRLNVPAGAGAREVCRFRLAWDAPGLGGRQTLTVPLRLPSVDAAAFEALAPVAEVRERADLLLIARHKKLAARQFERGDRDGAAGTLRAAGAILSAAPATPEMAREAQALGEVRAHLEGGDGAKFTKSAKYQSHQRGRSEPYREP